MTRLNASEKIGLSTWKDDELEYLAGCPACGATESSVLYEDLVDNVFRVSIQKWTLVKCLVCESAYLNPRPSAESIYKAYKEYYTHDKKDISDDRAKGILWRLKRMLANGYRNHRFGTKFEPALKLGAFLFDVLPQQRCLIERGLRNLPPLPADGRLLDVGFGDASFLLQARNGGWRVAGVDPDPIVVDNARNLGLEVKEGGIEAFDDYPESFDVITLSNVIEHLHDSVGFLRDVFRLLKPGGCLWLDTPNIDGPVHAIFGRYWRGLEPPRHLTIFNRASLISLLRNAGFVDIEDMPYAKGVIRQRMDASLKITESELADEQQKAPYRESVARINMLEKRAIVDPLFRDSVTLRCRKSSGKRK